ncbi:MAG TPA: hypothetical protein VEW93_00390 [Acidimicrobiales bacterium]|nr:hypothetical protein [Acidimicrobiales bacterium]
MSDSHKEAIKEGRVQAKAVADYLEALTANKPKRGRQRTPDSIKARIEAIDATVEDTDPLTQLNLRQEREDLQAELASKQASNDISALEEAFITHAGAYTARKGISYGVWRTSGVPAAVLKKAGISRSA